MASVRTRHKSASNLSEFLGTGQEFLVSELPTLRDVLRFGIFLREKRDDQRNYSVKDMVKDITPFVFQKWTKANALFRSPVVVSEARARVKIEDAWNLASRIARNVGAVKQDKKTSFVESLDKVFDILHCKKCPISDWKDFSCYGCDQKVYIVCNCNKKTKIPVKDLALIKS